MLAKDKEGSSAAVAHQRLSFADILSSSLSSCLSQNSMKEIGEIAIVARTRLLSYREPICVSMFSYYFYNVRIKIFCVKSYAKTWMQRNPTCCYEVGLSLGLWCSFVRDSRWKNKYKSARVERMLKRTSICQIFAKSKLAFRYGHAGVLFIISGEIPTK